MKQRIGEILDGLGVEQDLDEGDLIGSAVVITKVIGADGSIALGLAVSDGCDWVDQHGLIAAASDLLRSDPTE